MEAQLTNRSQAKHWCLTLNNYGEVEIANFISQRPNVHYYILGKEAAPTTNTPHLQCYIAFKQKKTLATLKKIWPTAHFEIARGTPTEASEYCKKDGDFEEFGTLPATAAKKGGDATKEKWDEMLDNAKKGEHELIPAKQRIQYYSTFKRIETDYREVPQPLDKIDNEWIYGATGVGKSTIARRENPDFYDKSHNKWFENYKGEACILIDDLGKECSSWIASYLKRWGDHYPFPIDVKYASNNIRPQRIVITSNYHPNELFSGEDLEAILRRYKIRHIEKLEDVDKTVSKKRRHDGVDQDVKIAKKPALFRQDANGEIVPNTNPVVQTTLDGIVQDINNVKDKLVESVAEFIEDLSK